MKKLMLLALMAILTASVFAQTKKETFQTAKDSDPQAKAVLEKVRKKYDAMAAMKVNFTMVMEIPNQPKETQKGEVSRSGDKYRFKLASQEVISDGKALWLILHNNKSVQINNLPEPGEDEGMLTPQSMFDFYKSGKFVYAMANESAMKDGTVLQEIEFKPLDKSADYHKLRLSVAKKTSEIKKIEAFAKDGSRFIFTIDAVSSKPMGAEVFAFSKAKFPGYLVSDLR